MRVPSFRRRTAETAVRSDNDPLEHDPQKLGQLAADGHGLCRDTLEPETFICHSQTLDLRSRRGQQPGRQDQPAPPQPPEGPPDVPIALWTLRILAAVVVGAMGRDLIALLLCHRSNPTQAQAIACDERGKVESETLRELLGTVTAILAGMGLTVRR